MFNRIWPTAVAGKADSVSSMSASACHIGGPNSVSLRYKTVSFQVQSKTLVTICCSFWCLLWKWCRFFWQKFESFLVVSIPIDRWLNWGQCLDLPWPWKQPMKERKPMATLCGERNEQNNIMVVCLLIARSCFSLGNPYGLGASMAVKHTINLTKPRALLCFYSHWHPFTIEPVFISPTLDSSSGFHCVSTPYGTS